MSRRGWGCRPLPNGASSHSSWPYIQPPKRHVCYYMVGLNMVSFNRTPHLVWRSAAFDRLVDGNALDHRPFQPRCSHLFLSQQNLLLRPNLKLVLLTFQAKTGDCNLRWSQVTPGSLRGSQVFSPAQLADGKGRLILPWLQPVSLQMIRDVDGKSLPAWHGQVTLDHQVHTTAKPLPSGPD